MLCQAIAVKYIFNPSLARFQKWSIAGNPSKSVKYGPDFQFLPAFSEQNECCAVTVNVVFYKLLVNRDLVADSASIILYICN